VVIADDGLYWGVPPILQVLHCKRHFSIRSTAHSSLGKHDV
jgi:hypothetical protein